MQKYLKALYAAALAGLGATYTAYAQGGGHISWAAGITIAISTITAAGVVWGVPNKTA